MSTGLMRLQLGLLSVALSLCTLVPLMSSAAILIPLRGVDTPAAWASRQGLPLLGHGRVPGSVLVYGPSAELGWRALRAGVLMVPVPEMMCSGKRTGTAPLRHNTM
ncbi:hypothetical protein GTZ99_07495 [Novosphingobium sp. FSY-8]|uniref:Uncharacterized protein n=1 Tax=Novosphingobium ovatum TaxID=1908523 RepID=A0ABW9XCX5_9SPHN|nr:hypothetical protein [Novosphingobium ovatum]